MTSHTIPAQRRAALVKTGAAALAAGLLAAAIFVVGPALAAGAAAEPNPRLERALANQSDYCTALVDDALTTRQRNIRADLCSMWTREVSDLSSATTAPPMTTTAIPPTTTAPPTTTTPAPTTASPTPPPTTTSPPASGWPDASSTGPNGTLTLRSSGMTISTDGAIVENLDIRGCVTITAANVVFRNSRVTCSAGQLAAINARTPGGTRIEDVEVSCARSQLKGILAEGVTIARTDISGCEDGVYIERNTVIVDSYIHDLYEHDNGCTPFPGCDRYGHTDGLQTVDDGDNVTIRGNYVSNVTPHGTSAYIGDGAGMDYIVMDRNYFDGEGTGYTLRCSSSGVGNTLTNNTITRGYWGYWTYCDRSGIARSGNTLL